MDHLPVQNCWTWTGWELLWLTGFLAVQVYSRSGSQGIQETVRVEPPKDSDAWVSPRVQMYRTPFPIPSTEHIKVMLQVPFSDMFTDFMVSQGFCSCSVGTVAMRTLLICLPQQERAERRQ